MDKDLTVPVKDSDWVKDDNTGFIAYAAWTAEDHTITFDVGKTSTKYDTKEVRPITGAADSVIPADQYPEVPLKFGYIFDGWSYLGKRYEFEEGKTKYPTKDIVLEAIWRSTEYSAFADVTAYEKLSGEYVETEPSHRDFLDRQLSYKLALLSATNIHTMQNTPLTHQERVLLLRKLNSYFQIHIPLFPKLKSIDILEEIFSEE